MLCYHLFQDGQMVGSNVPLPAATKEGTVAICTGADRHTFVFVDGYWRKWADIGSGYYEKVVDGMKPTRST